MPKGYKPEDMDAHRVPSLLAELKGKMPAYIKNDTIGQIKKHPMLVRNPSLMRYAQTTYEKTTGKRWKGLP
jgi:hypothetical protein